jgi:hypothetical protein
MITPSEIIIYLLLVLVILIILFLILRELNCWYWKINERIKLQKEILFYLKKLVPSEAIESKIGNDETPSDSMKAFLSSLTSEEKEIIDELRMQGLKIGEKIIIHKALRNILKVTAKEWNSYGNYQVDWIIIFE